MCLGHPPFEREREYVCVFPGGEVINQGPVRACGVCVRPVCIRVTTAAARPWKNNNENRRGRESERASRALLSLRVFSASPGASPVSTPPPHTLPLHSPSHSPDDTPAYVFVHAPGVGGLGDCLAGVPAPSFVLGCRMARARGPPPAARQPGDRARPRVCVPVSCDTHAPPRQHTEHTGRKWTGWPVCVRVRALPGGRSQTTHARRRAAPLFFFQTDDGQRQLRVFRAGLCARRPPPPPTCRRPGCQLCVREARAVCGPAHAGVGTRLGGTRAHTHTICPLTFLGSLSPTHSPSFLHPSLPPPSPTPCAPSGAAPAATRTRRTSCP